MVKEFEYERNRKQFASTEERDWNVKQTLTRTWLKRMFPEHKEIEDKAAEIKRSRASEGQE